MKVYYSYIYIYKFIKNVFYIFHQNYIKANLCILYICFANCLSMLTKYFYCTEKLLLAVVYTNMYTNIHICQQRNDNIHLYIV